MENIITVWKLFECKKGNRWSETNSPLNAHGSKDGDFCNFSGCKEKNHKIKLVRMTKKPPYKWFKSIYRD